MIHLLAAIPTNRKVICITGGLGQGKTLAMSAMLKDLKEWEDLPVYSNYELKGSTPLAQLNYLDIFSSRKPTIIALDETEQLLMHSPRFIHYLLSDFMKNHNVVLIFNVFSKTRLRSELAKRVDVFLEVKKVENEILVGPLNENATGRQLSYSIEKYGDLYDSPSNLSVYGTAPAKGYW